jgi:hypothetical protein
MSRVRVATGSLNNTWPWTVDRFKSMDDYFDAAYGSSSIVCGGSTAAAPNVNTSGTFGVYRGHPIIDGAYSATLDTLCARLPKGHRCVRLSSYDVGPYTKDAAALGAAAVSANHKKKRPSLPTDCVPFFNGSLYTPDWLPATSPPPGVQPDILPGGNPDHPLPFTKAEWQEMSLDAATAAPNWQAMYEIGAADGAYFALQQQQQAAAGRR